MYLFSVVALLLFVYIIPGLAFFPIVLKRPLWFFAVPILSAFIVYCLSSVLILLGLFEREVVLLLCIILFLVTLFHLYKARGSFSKIPLFFSNYGVFLVINFLVILPFACKLGTHAFDRGDEIYSWHFWAIQHFFSQPIDFSNTGAAYPQLLPKILAWGYQILGTIDAQLPSKACLIVFPFTLLNAIAFTAVKQGIHRVSYLALLIWGLFGIGLSRYFDNGYADPVMTASLVMSAGLFIQGLKHKNMTALWLSLICGLAASFSKQPALMWSLWAFPAGLMIFCWKQEKEKKQKQIIILIATLSISGALLWFFTEGSTFLKNEGVIVASFKGRSFLEQLYYSINEYLIKKPLFLLMLLGTAYWIRRDKVSLFLFYAFVLPALFAWFIAGAYQLRLGQHIIAYCMLLIWVTPLKLSERPYLLQFGKYIVNTVLCLSLVFSGWILFRAIYIMNPGISWDQPGLITMKRYFPTEASQLYARLYNKPDILLWVPTGYLYGIFYAHTPVMAANLSRFTHYDKTALLTELLEERPDYVFTASSRITHSGILNAVQDLIVECPNWFEKISTGPNLYDYQVYALDLRQSCEQLSSKLPNT